MPLPAELIDELEGAAPGALRLNAPLHNLSRWRIGGFAEAVVEPRDAHEAARVMAAVAHRPIPFIVVGETSNLLFDSKGLDGIVIRIGSSMSDLEFDGTTVWAQAGISVPTLVHTVASRALTGIEHTVGIPGTLGGLVLMNGGSQRRGIGENVQSVKCVDAGGNMREFSQAECKFEYRKSALSDSPTMVLEVVLRLDAGDKAAIQDRIRSILSDRADKFPTEYPNCGSTFLSDPRMYSTIGPPGRVIEQAGLKGFRVGDAQVSTKHANFLLNLGSASSDDILLLIAIIRSTVFRRTGYTMNCEVRYVSPQGQVRPAHEMAVAKWGNGIIK